MRETNFSARTFPKMYWTFDKFLYEQFRVIYVWMPLKFHSNLNRSEFTIHTNKNFTTTLTTTAWRANVDKIRYSIRKRVGPKFETFVLIAMFFPYSVSGRAKTKGTSVQRTLIYLKSNMRCACGDFGYALLPQADIKLECFIVWTQHSRYAQIDWNRFCRAK